MPSDAGCVVQGWEDLRLDERLMQLVRAFSVTLGADPDTARRQLLPCPLSVTPLGGSMGLIQWVDHTMPLYGVYKAWQQRQLAEKAGKRLGYGNVPDIVHVIPCFCCVDA